MGRMKKLLDDVDTVCAECGITRTTLSAEAFSRASGIDDLARLAARVDQRIDRLRATIRRRRLRAAKIKRRYAATGAAGEPSTTEQSPD